MMETGNPLDVALDGPGFFRVKTPDGERLTRMVGLSWIRAVHWSQSMDTPSSTHPVHPSSLRMVKLILPMMEPLPSMEMLPGNSESFSFLDPRNELVRDDNNTFIAKGTATGTEKGVVVQSYLESSNSNTASLMTQLVQVTRSYEAAQQLVSNQDELLGKTISSLGRIG